MSAVKNILFIMCDQLRWDYLSCTGHPHLQTPNIDALAARGAVFDRAYCQAPICGPSRMSFYTGRYPFTLGSGYNNFPPRVDEMTLGDHLRPLGLRTLLVGKTHMAANREDMQRLGIDPKGELGVLLSQCGFEPFERDDGLHPNEAFDPNLRYNVWLRGHGYDSPNPWHDFANAAEGPDGEVLSGWHMKWAHLPARVKAEHSETAYMTGRAMDCIAEQGDQPWCIHLSYIKPHWPYVAPAPYHNLYGKQHLLPLNQGEAERERPHPVHAAFMQHGDSETFARPEVREHVIPAYMGLVKEIDDQLGRLWAFLEERGLFETTMIVFTSDHGDYLGDHYLGEKELLHEESVRIPLIVYDPRPEADASRGRHLAAPVEGVDLVPTFVEAVGGAPALHWLEGASLQPLLFGGDAAARKDAAFSEIDYSMRDARAALGVAPAEAKGYMVRTRRYKYLFWEGFPAQLFDLDADPVEQTDLGADPAHAAVMAEMRERLFRWFRHRKLRVTRTDARILATAGEKSTQSRGIYRGYWGPDD
ncbi:MAG: sulfatase-like hydrolase/transferase [Alphaproteobacteria bacterium]|nr:sulfatase-like hydrolase/transferase [Alphaproteobacteria bacterium]MCB9930996.1 sulfatase-like hydrolase/transferase [Alphaproteobacteria bacterium]